MLKTNCIFIKNACFIAFYRSVNEIYHLWKLKREIINVTENILNYEKEYEHEKNQYYRST